MGRRMRNRQNDGSETSWVTRRAFLELSVAGALLAGAAGTARAARGDGAAGTRTDGIPRRTLGRTGEKVSMVGLGGAHIGRQYEEQESIRIIRTAIDSGINFMDNCWDYNDGKSEERMGKALRAPGGALEAVLAAKQAGKVRYIGFTGHKSPDIHLHMLETAAAHDFTFDTVQMPLNLMDAHFDSFARRVLPVAVSRNMGVLGMKPMGDGIILESKKVTALECLHYAMNLPVSVVITGCDSIPIVRQAVDAAQSFRPLSEAQVAAMLAKTAQAAENGRYEKYKTSEHFDSTAKHPEWLG